MPNCCHFDTRKYSIFAQDFVTVHRSAKFKSCVLFTKQIISWHFVTNVTETEYLIWHSKWRRMWTHLKFWLGAIHQFWAKYQLPSACQYLINTWKGPKGLIIYLCNFSAIVRWFPERFTILREKNVAIEWTKICQNIWVAHTVWKMRDFPAPQILREITAIRLCVKYVIARSLCGMQRFCNIPRDEMPPKGWSKTFASQTMIVQ